MPRFVCTEDGRVLRYGNPGDSDWLTELVDGEFVAPTRPVYGDVALDARPLSEEEVANLVKSTRRPAGRNEVN